MAKKFEYDLNYDFREVRNVRITETLSQEDIEDGLEAEQIDLQVALTSHALDRMNDTEGRDCEWELVEDLIVRKGNVLFSVKNGEEFLLVNEKQTLALVCQMHQQNGIAVLVLITVIRKVYMDRNLQEREKRVYVDKSAQVVY